MRLISLNSRVAIPSSFGDKVSARRVNVGADEKMHFPGFHVEAGQMLTENTGAVALAVDTLSLDHGISADFATHYAWLPSNRYGIENLKGLDQVPASGATLIVGANTHKGEQVAPAVSSRWYRQKLYLYFRTKKGQR